tara:strand:+ start:2647 stop:3297 length:651 start_codon:yes stop_codon:yes gene_type:complete
MKIFSKINIIIITLFFIFLIILNYEKILTKYAELYVINNPSKGADAVIVLSGSSFTRIPKAIDLLKNGYSSRILLTTTKSINKKFDVLINNNLEEAKKIAKLVNSKAKFIQIPSLSNGATSTFDEAYDLLNFTKNNTYKHIIVVTDFYHSKRAKVAFSKIFKKSNIKIEYAVAYNDIFDTNNWWKSDIGLSTFLLEPVKLLIYYFTSSNIESINNY